MYIVNLNIFDQNTTSKYSFEKIYILYRFILEDLYTELRS